MGSRRGKNTNDFLTTHRQQKICNFLFRICKLNQLASKMNFWQSRRQKKVVISFYFCWKKAANAAWLSYLTYFRHIQQITTRQVVNEVIHRTSLHFRCIIFTHFNKYKMQMLTHQFQGRVTFFCLFSTRQILHFATKRNWNCTKMFASDLGYEKAQKRCK